jgi:imidazolonepropionase-like amidohydrolase
MNPYPGHAGFRVARGLLIIVLVNMMLRPVYSQDLAVKARRLHTMTGAPIENGVVVVRDGKITAVGPAAQTPIPEGFRVLEAVVVTPGLIDAHSTVGLSGIYNQPHDQDQLERSTPIQPELRAIDAYNARDPLIEWIRGFGVTTVHTGHAPGELITGQTILVKTAGDTVENALVKNPVAIAATLGPLALKRDGGQSPGTRGKQLAMLREQLVKAREYMQKLEKAEPDKKPDRDLKLEALVHVLQKELPLLVTAHRAQDIQGVLRLAAEFEFTIWLDGAAEAYLFSGSRSSAHDAGLRRNGEFELRNRGHAPQSRNPRRPTERLRKLRPENPRGAV